MFGWMHSPVGLAMSMTRRLTPLTGGATEERVALDIILSGGRDRIQDGVDRNMSAGDGLRMAESNNGVVSKGARHRPRTIRQPTFNFGVGLGSVIIYFDRKHHRRG